MQQESHRELHPKLRREARDGPFPGRVSLRRPGRTGRQSAVVPRQGPSMSTAAPDRPGPGPQAAAASGLRRALTITTAPQGGNPCRPHRHPPTHHPPATRAERRTEGVVGISGRPKRADELRQCAESAGRGGVVTEAGAVGRAVQGAAGGEGGEQAPVRPVPVRLQAPQLVQAVQLGHLVARAQRRWVRVARRAVRRCGAGGLGTCEFDVTFRYRSRARQVPSSRG